MAVLPVNARMASGKMPGCPSRRHSPCLATTMTSEQRRIAPCRAGSRLARARRNPRARRPCSVCCSAPSYAGRGRRQELLARQRRPRLSALRFGGRDLPDVVYRLPVKHEQKGGSMTTSETAPGNGKAGRLPFDTTKAHQARMYDYALGGCFL
jgi:hypothetical protein